MLPFRRSYWLDDRELDGGRSTLTTSSKVQRKSTAACSKRHNHREAERRRRHRINTHLATLRSLLPDAPNAKSDKASLLGEVVQHVKEQRKQADDVARRHDAAGSVQYPQTEPWLFLGELDEATVSYCGDDEEPKLMKSTLCCEDRPGLNRDFMQGI